MLIFYVIYLFVFVLWHYTQQEDFFSHLCDFISFNRFVSLEGSWFKGCYSDADLLTNYENVDISGDIDGLSTAFTDENAIACAVKCSTRKTPKKYAIFSQTGVCLCAAQAFNISATVSSSLCLSKSCDFNQTITDCDQETSYHWLVDTTFLLTAINIVTSGMLHGSVPQNITVVTISGELFLLQSSF